MQKLIVIFLLAATTFILAAIFIGPKLGQPVLPTTTSRLPEKITDQAKNGVSEILGQAKNSLLITAKNAVDSVDKAVSDSIVANNPVKVNVLSETPASSQDNTITVDFSAQNNFQWTIQKGAPYFLKFKNLPENFCLFINAVELPINNADAVQVQFTNSGQYPLKVDSCVPSVKTLGQIVVQ